MADVAGLRANLAKRTEILRAAENDDGFQQALMEWCRVDPLFWCNVFCWTIDPRLPPMEREQPFVLYPYQEWALLGLLAAEGAHPAIAPFDVVIEKSRTMGASWLNLLADIYQFLFVPFSSFMWVSRKEELVDNRDNLDALFPKARFLLDRLPRWMWSWGWCDDRFRHLANKKNGSLIDGEATTGDVTVGGRRTSVLLDEFARVKDQDAVLRGTADVTQCRRFNSTPLGQGNAFYRLTMDPRVEKFWFHWSVHPVYAEGIERALEYRHVPAVWRDMHWTSPWYRAQKARGRSDRDIAENLDLDYHGSGSPYFDGDALNVVAEKDVREPSLEGELEFTVRPGEVVDVGFGRHRGGRLKLWLALDGSGKPPKDRKYVVGADISAGTGASNSVIEVLDAKTGEQVGEFATPYMGPEKLAPYGVALCQWFNGAFHVWEDNGPGRTYGKSVVRDYGYGNVYMRGKGKTLDPGWHSTQEGKYDLLEAYRKKLCGGYFRLRSQPALDEHRQYVYLPTGMPGFAGMGDDEDPSGAKSNHGDRVMGCALASMGLDEAIETEAATPDVPEWSFAGRRQKWEADQRAKTEVQW